VINITSKEGQPATLGSAGGTIYYNDGVSDFTDRVWVRMGADNQVLMIAKAPRMGLPETAGLEVTVVERNGYLEVVDWNRNDEPAGHVHDFDTANVIVSNTAGGSAGNNNTVMGFNAGESITAGGNSNVLIGYLAGDDLTIEDSCIFVGSQAGGASTGSSDSIFIGASAGKNAVGEDNIVIGASAWDAAGVTGTANVIIGDFAASSSGAVDQDFNVFIGASAAQSKGAGDYNVYAGNRAGRAAGGANYSVGVGFEAGENHTGDYGVFLGHQAGESTTDSTDYLLYINAGGHGTPLIYGEFNNDNLGINTKDMASGVGVIAIADRTTAPSGTPSGGGVLYVESGALKYKGSSGTVTTIANA
jgi:hypothetical protein